MFLLETQCVFYPYSSTSPWNSHTAALASHVLVAAAFDSSRHTVSSGRFWGWRWGCGGGRLAFNYTD